MRLPVRARSGTTRRQGIPGEYRLSRAHPYPGGENPVRAGRLLRPREGHVGRAGRRAGRGLRPHGRRGLLRRAGCGRALYDSRRPVARSAVARSRRLARHPAEGVGDSRVEHPGLPHGADVQPPRARQDRGRLPGLAPGQRPVEPGSRGQPAAPDLDQGGLFPERLQRAGKGELLGGSRKPPAGRARAAGRRVGPPQGRCRFWCRKGEPSCSTAGSGTPPAPTFPRLRARSCSMDTATAGCGRGTTRASRDCSTGASRSGGSCWVIRKTGDTGTRRRQRRTYP